MCGSFFVNYRMQAGNLAMFLTRNSSICRHIAVLKPRIVRKIFAQAPCSVHTKTMSNGYTLVSFDVDGTLIHSIGQRANKLHKDAFAHAFKAVFNLDTHIDVVKHHGSTDPLIIIKVLEHHGISKDEAMKKLPECEQAMNDYFTGHAAEAADGLEILPGVAALLEKLQKHGGAASCLVTGNLEPIGWGKMQALGIEHLFAQPHFGGFGSDFCSGNTEESWRDRAQFVRIAAEKGQKSIADAASGFKARFHVGDTPMDIQAAIDAGATAIAVATGVFTKEQLAAVAPGKDVVLLDSLEDTDAVMRAMGLA